MSDHMSTAEYRKQIVEPALKNEAMPDHEFQKAVREVEKKGMVPAVMHLNADGKNHVAGMFPGKKWKQKHIQLAAEKALKSDAPVFRKLTTADVENIMDNGITQISGFRAVQTKNNSLPGPTEHEIQSSILERLNFLKNAFFWRENSGLVRIPGANGKDRMFRAGISGIADIMGIWNGTPIAIEVKRPGKKPTPNQIAFKVRYEMCGGVYVVCTDAAEVVRQIEEGIHEKNL